jgi:glyoxylase-like metal-dependent hydrolase (beta-lactamase superfamily II)
MRVLALHSDVIVFVSDVWQTTSTAIRASDEGLLIDSPLYPEELRALANVLEQAEFPISGLLATHGDWDHLLGRLAFPQAALGVAQSTVARLAAQPGAAQRKLRDFDAEHYVQRSAPLSLGTLQSLPVPGTLELGAAHEMELYEATGHTGDGVAFWIPWVGVLVCGDYLSPVEIPMLSPGGSLHAYRATVTKLSELAGEAGWVVPGHGAPLGGEQAVQIAQEDLAYLDALERDPDGAALPRGATSAIQKRIHAENVALLEANGR